MTPTTNNGTRDPGSGDHRSEAEAALAHAQRNPVLSAEQSFLSAQVHALLALEARLGEIVVALRDANISAPPAEASLAAWPDLPAPAMVPPVEAER
jgi:hypothetical protein